jgi:hypothetical protein
MISFRSHTRTDAHRVSEQFPAVSAQSLQSLFAGSGVALKQLRMFAFAVLAGAGQNLPFPDGTIRAGFGWKNVPLPGLD